MKIIAVVAARGGSKSIKNKNIKLIGKKNLINHILSTLLKVKEINRVILSSDSNKIINIAKKNNIKKLETRLRPKKLSQDGTPLTSVAYHVALELNNEGYRPDFVLQVAPTWSICFNRHNQKDYKNIKTKKIFLCSYSQKN